MGDLTKNLSRHEFACKCGCGFDDISGELIGLIQAAADHFLRPPAVKTRVDIHSGCRCASHNKIVKGSPKSQHLLGKAADHRIWLIMPSGGTLPVATDILANWYESIMPDRGGIGRYIGRVHLDVRETASRWDMRYAG